MANKRRLQRIFICFIVVVFTFVIAGCVKTDNNESISNESYESNESNANTDYTDEKDGYTMDIKYSEDGKFDFTITPKVQVYSDDAFYQPFKNIFDLTAITGTVNPKRAYHNFATIEYNKREGGAYIYSNNPEMLAVEDVGQAIIRNYNMQGEYIFTFEHSNHTGEFFYLGYQLYNTGDTDAVVTVYNIGYQEKGEWLGQKSWSDYFNYKFILPDDYFLSNGSVNPIYFGCDYIDYTPRVFEPVTVTVPAGEYIYILGGTTADAYNNTNIGKTANLRVENGRCANGAVKFSVQGGTVQGSFYCYDNASQVIANPAEQGYIVNRNGTNYAAQYKGTDYKQGLIESNITFIVNDLTQKGKLPVKYVKEYDPNHTAKNTPYAPYSPITKSVSGNTWQTSLNPNNAPDAIGTDMMVFEYIDTDGNPIIIDNVHADGVGQPANTGNWMVQYTDNFNLVNVGDTARTFRIYKKGAMSGALFTMVRNDKGEIMDARMKANPYYFESLDKVFYGVDKSLLFQKNGYFWFKVADGRPYMDVVDERSLVCEITVAPMSMERISVDYLILGNSNGGILHWVEVS
ncbi:MAG: hypothetical protein CVU97_00645 [Firmicutes bacterium HGW-Firmicutes-21]|nr:MAG: hypothetical protein CVU97_00645 [Firmicutes bacterium HGW-Firmicutes-21]